MPRTTFGLIPDVERPTATSPGRQSASSWRANTSSNAPSFATAVSSAPSVVSAIDASPGSVDEVATDELGREVLALRSAATVAEPEDGPPPAQRLGHPLRDSLHVRNQAARAVMTT